ncbi:MAG: hypothetical protein ABEJ44_06150 [Halanaeroarchaeum sp.]
MVPPPEDDEPPTERALSPEELDLAAEERVAELEEGRYVIGADDPPKTTERTDAPTGNERDSSSKRTLEDLQRESVSDPSDDRRSVLDSGDAGAELTDADVKRWISADLDRTDSQYAYRIAAKAGDSVSHQQLASDDIGTAFDGLMMWYAQQVAAGTPIEEALGILLAESTIPVRYPVAGLVAYLQKHDLEKDDSIGELLATIRRTDGLVFPLRDRRG